MRRAKKAVIRYWRRGHKGYAVYHIVVIFSSKRARGPCLERLGYLNPQKKERQLVINLARLAFWLNKGAYLHPHVARLLSYLAF